jgi:hypothetical protein
MDGSYLAEMDGSYLAVHNGNMGTWLDSKRLCLGWRLAIACLIIVGWMDEPVSQVDMC